MASVRKRTWQTARGEAREAWVVAYQHKGKQHLKTFKTKREATAWRADTQVEIKRGTHTPASKSPTVAEAGNAWLEQARVDGLERATILTYSQHFKFHIAPFIGDVKLAALTPADIQDFSNRLIRDGRSPMMAKKVVSSLGAIIAHAMERGQVAQNVVAGRNRRRATRLAERHQARLEVGVDIPTKDEIRAILGAAEGRWRPLLVTAIFTGLRASELRGLRWQDVDLDAAVLRVVQRADRFQSIGSPKSRAGQRTIPLAPIVTNTLKEWRLACPKGALDLGVPRSLGRGRDPQHSPPPGARRHAAQARLVHQLARAEIRDALAAPRRGEPVHRAGHVPETGAGADGPLDHRHDIRSLRPLVSERRRRRRGDAAGSSAAHRLRVIAAGNRARP